MSLYETGVRPIIDAYLLEESKKVRDYGEYFSASSAGYCMRKVIFEKLGVPKIEQDGDARKQRVFSAGHVFHSWIQELTKKAGVSIAQEVELQDEELKIRGHFDDLLLIDGNLILVDYKTVNSRSFMWAKKKGNAMSHYHRLQLGTYMYMLRMTPDEKLPKKVYEANRLYTRVSESRILKIEKENLMMMEQQLMWTPDLERDVVQYWRTLNGYWKNKKLPKCTCLDFEGGFMAKEAYNGYFYNEEPCSIEYFNKMKAENKIEAYKEN